MKTDSVRYLKAGVFAAGQGRRLQTKATCLKPLVKVGNRTLVEHVLDSMAEAGASEVVVIINEDSVAVREHVTAAQWPFLLHWIVETTPSSMHSFLRLVETLAADGNEGPFLLSTVDTVAERRAYSQFVSQVDKLDPAAVTLALTSPTADENPLHVRLEPGNSRVIAIGSAAVPSQYVTAGVYAVRPTILLEADAARRDGVDALRIFLGRLLDRGYEIAGIPITETIDVDCPADIETATAFLRTTSV